MYPSASPPRPEFVVAPDYRSSEKDFFFPVLPLTKKFQSLVLWKLLCCKMATWILPSVNVPVFRRPWEDAKTESKSKKLRHLMDGSETHFLSTPAVENNKYTANNVYY